LKNLNFKIIPNTYKKPKYNPLHFERAYLVHFPLDWNVFYIFGCVRWGLQNCLKFQKQWAMDKKVIMIPSLSV